MSGGKNLSEAEIKHALGAWVKKVSRKPEAASVTDETPLIESRLITSLQIMELILEIERLKGQPFELRNLKPGVFNTINSIYATFFGA